MINLVGELVVSTPLKNHGVKVSWDDDYSHLFSGT